MPVNVPVPRLQKIAPSNNLPKNDRILSRATNTESTSILKITEGITGVASQALRTNKAYEDSKIDSISSENNRAYAEWVAQQQELLKADKGDPTKSFADFYEREREFLQGLSDRNPNLNDRVGKGVSQNLAKSQSSNRIKMLHQNGYQKEIYEGNLYNSDIKLNEDNLVETAGHIQEGDRTTTDAFNSALNNIKTIVAKNAVKNGTAVEVTDIGENVKSDWTYQDTDGNRISVNFNTSISQAELTKQMNKGVNGAVDHLIATGKNQSAKNMMKDYSKFLDNKSVAKFERRLKQGETEREARVKLTKMAGKSEDQILRAIDKEKDSKVRSEMISIKNHNDGKMAQMRKRKEDKNHAFANEELEKLRATGNLITERSITDNPKIKRIFNNLSKTQQAAMMNDFRSPKVSDVKAVTRMTDIILGTHPTLKMEDMTSAQIAEASVGLSTPHGNQLRAAVVKTQTAGGDAKSDRSTIIRKEAQRLLTSLMYADEHIENDKRGFLTKKSAVINNKSRLELINYLNVQDIDRNPSDAVIFQHVRDFVAEKTKAKLFGSNAWFETKEHSPKREQKPNADPFEGLDKNQMRGLRRDYMDKTGADLPRDGDNSFRNWAIKNNRGNR